VDELGQPIVGAIVTVDVLQERQQNLQSRIPAQPI